MLCHILPISIKYKNKHSFESLRNFLRSHESMFLFTAHEITHAFDDVGIQYDSTGSYRALYDNETVSKFHEASGKTQKLF